MESSIGMLFGLFMREKKNHNSWLMIFLSEDFTVSCIKTTCQVLEEDMLIDLKGPMWDGGFVLIGIRLARKPGLKQGFGQTVFDILNPLRDFKITLPLHTWVFGTEKVCRK